MMKRATLGIGIGLTIGIAPVLIGCASTNDEAAVTPAPEPPLVSGSMVWLASAKPGFATIQRDTHYAIVYDAYRDLVVLEDETHEGRLTWLISIPASAPAGATLGVADPSDPMSGGAWGWLYEDLHGAPGHAAPLRGSLTVDSRHGDAMGVSVDLVAETGVAQAGARRGLRTQLAGSAGLSRHTPTRIGYAPMDRRSGTQTREPEKTEPIWATLWNFPEPEPPRDRFGRRQP